MRKVAIISTVGLKYDGITSVILSYLESMDLKGLDIYIVATNDCEQPIISRLTALGCHIVWLPSRKEHPIIYFVKLSEFIRRKKIDVTHAHGNSATLAIELMAAYFGGCKVRIAHSHNTKCHPIIADKMMRPIFSHLYTKALACSSEAGKWLFKNNQFLVLTNGRNISRYQYNEGIRSIVRKKLGVQSQICIGHVGGFYEQKNHKFLIDIFKEINKREKNVKFFLIGDGPLREQIEKISQGLDITFTGNIDNVSDYLNAMDGMLLPSLFEGLPLVAVEWQINGLPCILSDRITRECSLTKTVAFMGLEDPAAWAKKILSMITNNKRKEQAEEACRIIQDSRFNLEREAHTLRRIYMEGVE